MPTLIRKLLPLMLLPLATASFAHHGLANFDLNTDITIKGTIAEVALINPHSWLYINVKEKDGSTTKWKCELRGGTVLRRSGWTDKMFVPGSDVTVTGSPDRFDKNTCYMGSVYFANGNKMDRYGQLVDAERKVRKQMVLNRLPNGNPDIGGDWAAEQVVMTDPRGLSGTLVPLGTADKSGVLVSSRPTMRTPTAMPATNVSTGIHQRDRRWDRLAFSSAWCFGSVPATWRLLGWSG